MNNHQTQHNEDQDFITAGLIDINKALPPKTTPPTHCHIWTKPDLTIEELQESTKILTTFEDDSDLIRRLLRCKQCRQLYFYEFYEHIDWEGGNDAQYRTWIPVDNKKSAKQLSEMSTWAILNYPRIQYDWPSNAKEPRGPSRPKLD